jgi:heterodisulfide reductase subunit A
MKSAAIIGGGITGIQAALDIANAGIDVYLIERNPSIGGHMSQLSETFPTLDCSQCILTPKMVEVKEHPKIHLLTYSEVLEVSGKVGSFKMKVLKKPRYVIEEKCNSCGECIKVCPVIVPNEFERGLSVRHAIYIPFAQAVPSVYTIDAMNCLNKSPFACEFCKEGCEERWIQFEDKYFACPLLCGRCKEVCEQNAIDFDMQPQIISLDIGAIIVATGYELSKIPQEFGYGKYPDVLDGLEFERLLSASGPTNGEIRRPSDNEIPKDVVFISCVGSRDPAHAFSYCSKICCMYMAKHAMLYKHKVPDGNAYVFYIDIRAGGKGYKEFIQRAIVEEKVKYIRGRVSKVFKRGKKLVVRGVDTIAREKIEILADLVVLARAIVPSEGIKELAKKLNILTNEYGFFNEADVKFQPIESLNKGIFFAGCSQAPKDIPECVTQASAAASKVISLLLS